MNRIAHVLACFHVSIGSALLAFFFGFAEDTATVPVRQWNYGMLHCLALSSDGTWFLTGSADGRIRMFDTAGGSPIRTFESTPSSIDRIALSGNGKTAVSIPPPDWNKRYVAAVWDVASGKLLHELTGHTCPITDIALSRDGTKLITGSYDSTARIWDVPTGTLIRTLHGHTNQVISVAMSSDGLHAVSVAHNNAARYWSTDADTALKFKNAASWGQDPRAVAFDAQASNVFIGYFLGGLHKWNLAADSIVQSFESTGNWLTAITVSVDGSKILSNPDIWTLSSAKATTLPASTDIFGAGFFPDGLSILAGWNGNAVILDAATGNTLRTYSGHSQPVYSVTFSPDGSKVACGDLSGKVKILNVSNGTLVRTMSEHVNSVQSVRYSRDGSKMVTSDGTAVLWDAGTGTSLKTFAGRIADISPDGTKVLTGESGKEKTVSLFDAATGNPIFAAEASRYVLDASFSGDGSLFLAACVDTSIRIWNTQSGSLVKMLRHPESYPYCAAFSPDGSLIVSGTYDSLVILWDVAAGIALDTIREQGHVYSVAFSPDGSKFLTGLYPSRARLWDVSTRTCLRTFLCSGAGTMRGCFSPDGSKIATGSEAGSLCVWDLRGNATPVCAPVNQRGKPSVRLLSSDRHALLFAVPGEMVGPSLFLDLYRMNGRLAARIPMRQVHESGDRVLFRLPRALGAGMYVYGLTDVRAAAKEIKGVCYVGGN